MAETHGFDIVAQASVAVLKELMIEAWKSGGWIPGNPPSTGVNPQSFDFSGQLGPYTLDSGSSVQIPENELDLTMDPGVNGVDLKFGLQVQAKIKNPEVPSAQLFTFHSEVHAHIPIDVIDPAKNNVGLILTGLPLENVTVTLTAGDPVDPQLETFVKDKLDLLYQSKTIPDAPPPQKDKNVGFFYTVDIYTRIFDDNADPNHRISVARLNPHAPNEALRLSIPIRLQIANIRPIGIAPPLQDPMQLEAKLVVLVPASDAPGSCAPGGDMFRTYAAKLSAVTQAMVSAENIVPSADDLGAHYTANKATATKYGQDLDALLAQQISQQGFQMIQGLAATEGDPLFHLPALCQVENAIRKQFHDQLVQKGSQEFWNPSQSAGAQTISSVQVKALPDALAIAINAVSGADLNALTNFIPAGADFGIALRGQFVLDKINTTIGDTYGTDLGNHPFRFHDVHDYDVDLHGLSASLVSGAIRFNGNISVIDAILGKYDVNASFTDDVGLTWLDDPNTGGQNMAPVLSNPDIDVSIAAWLISIIIDLIIGGGGLLGTLIGGIIQLVVSDSVKSVGSDFIKDQVGKIFVLSPWPKQLTKIGTVDSRYLPFISIEPSGLLFSGGMHVQSAYALVPKVFANAQGPYTVTGGSPLTLKSAQTDPAAGYQWDLGDGSAAVTANVVHSYAQAGIYLAELGLTVKLPGGNFSRKLAMIKVENSAPTVQAPPDRTIYEGEEVSFTASFTDQQWPDQHHSVWVWDDYQGPSAGTVSETNVAPAAKGSATGSHAWGHSGIYHAAVMVLDDKGGVGQDTFQVTVLNVPPTVSAGPSMFAYPCTVITLEGKFTDPSWLDTHTGSWDFGDCTPPLPAIIQETHTPPLGKGVALASHVYHCCGGYRTVCTVVDDEGAVGQDSSVVHVVQVENAHFEEGFRGRLAGAVANGWEPYSAPAPELLGATPPSPPPPGVTYFFAEEFRVHSGERSQGIRGEDRYRAGVYQKIGANPGWDYQVAVWYAIAERPPEKVIVSTDPAVKKQQQEINRIRAAGTARLGIDPEGGSDPTAPGIIWSAGLEQLRWAQLSARAGARKEAITVFLEAVGVEQLSHEVYFDDVELIPIQPFCAAAPPPQREACLNLSDLKAEQEIPPEFRQDGFTLRTPDKKPRRIVSYGVPAGQNKLELGVGLSIELPFVAEEVEIDLSQTASTPVAVSAFDSGDFPVAQTNSQPGGGTLEVVRLQAAGMVRVEIQSARSEALLLRICLRGEVPAGNASERERGN
jgi:hypothetical protein